MKVIYYLRITLAIVICILQIGLIVLAQKSQGLSRVETVRQTLLVATQEPLLTNSHKKLPLILLIEESHNISKLATL